MLRVCECAFVNMYVSDFHVLLREELKTYCYFNDAMRCYHFAILFTNKNISQTF